MLSSYYQHVCQYKNSLVTKFFGVHCVKPVGGQKVWFWQTQLFIFKLPKFNACEYAIDIGNLMIKSDTFRCDGQSILLRVSNPQTVWPERFFLWPHYWQACGGNRWDNYAQRSWFKLCVSLGKFVVSRAYLVNSDVLHIIQFIICMSLPLPLQPLLHKCVYMCMLQL